MALKQISSTDVLIGKPLEQAIYNASGQLLLNKGAVLDDKQLKEKLLEQGHKEVLLAMQAQKRAQSQATAGKDGMFAVVQHAATTLALILRDFQSNLHQEQFQARIQSIASRLLQAAAQDAEAAIAAIHLFHEGEYSIRHHLSVGVVSALLAEADGTLNKAEILSLVCAAITHDIGILGLANNEAELPADKKKLVNQHPLTSAQALQKVGISDKLWLQAVLQHHERLDGSGYPHALQASQISLAGKLLAVADVYCAMTRPRPYRPKAYFPMAAMRDLYVGQSRQLDNQLIQKLIKAMGLIPPGTLVKLKNGEIAVVKQRTTKNTPLCYCLYNRQGMPMTPPEIRNTALPDYAIQGRVDYEDCRQMEIALRRLWA